MLRAHQAGLGRLRALREAYDGDAAILSRARRRGLPNNRLAHPIPRYIVAVTAGYLAGQPVTYSAEAPNATLVRIQELFRRGSESAENAQIARDMGIYGKGVEYVHLDGGTRPLPHTTAVSPENAFVVYDDTCDGAPLFGVYCARMTRADGAPEGWRVLVMTDSVIARYEAATLESVGEPAQVEPHYFGGVPLVEYWNDDREKGDFEWVLPLIDAYDKLQSDRVNDKEQFVDKLLVLSGAVLETDERGREPMQQLREDKALQLPDAAARAEYLTSEMREADVEVLRAALMEDIHKLSLVPDLSDRNFAANASGVAMRYKLWGLEQLIGVKQRWFTEGLRQRLSLYAHYLELLGSEPLDVAGVRIAFTRAMPANMLEQAQIARTASAAGAASLETLVEILHEGGEWSAAEVDREAASIRSERANEDPGEGRKE